MIMMGHQMTKRMICVLVMGEMMIMICWLSKRLMMTKMVIVMTMNMEYHVRNGEIDPLLIDPQDEDIERSNKTI